MNYKFSHFLFIFLMFGSSATAMADMFREPIFVKYVIDGTSFFDESDNVIKLWGIEAPEAKSYYGKMSQLFLKSLIENQNVECIDKGEDPLLRRIMQCFTDESDIASLSVQLGLSKDITDFPEVGHYYSYEEQFARENAKGLWKKNTGLKRNPR